MTSQTSFNPYQAPTQTARTSGLAADTEFLVSGQCILCQDSVSLPQVCIESGETDVLVEHSAVLRWEPLWIRNVAIVTTLIGLPVSGNLILYAFQQNVATGQSMTSVRMVPLVAALAVILTAVASWAAVWKSRRTISATWWVESKLLEQRRRQRKRATRLMLVLLLMFPVGLAAGISFESPVFLAIGWLCMWTPLVVYRFRKMLPAPVLIGNHEGLNVVGGLSPSFLQQVHSIIRQYEDVDKPA